MLLSKNKLRDFYKTYDELLCIISYLQTKQIKNKNIYSIRNNTVSIPFVRSNGSKDFVRNRNVGSPDIIALIDGIYFGIEVKSATGKMSNAQVKAKEQIISAGGQYLLVKSLDELLQDLKEFGIDL